MLYDLAQAPPEQGSLLESVLLIISKRRQEQEFLKTRVLVEATLAPHLEGESKVSETFKDYMDTMFPYLGEERDTKETLAKQALDHWVGKGPLRVRPLWQSAEKPRRIRSALQRGAEKVREIEKMRREGRLKRMS